jgi:hypothetical protein
MDDEDFVEPDDEVVEHIDTTDVAGFMLIDFILFSFLPCC